MNIKSGGETIVLPDFLIVGAAKAGTTTLYGLLGATSDVFFPKVKEPFFFSFMDTYPTWNSPEQLDMKVTQLKEYTSLFSKAKPYQLLAEASTSYLYDYATTIRNIQHLYGDKYQDVKIIILLREPIARLWSHYLHLRKFDKEPLDFQTAIHPDTIVSRLHKGWCYYYDYLGFSKYQPQVEAYQEAFPNVLVLNFADIKHNPQQLYRQVSSFLSIPFQPDGPARQYNVGGVPKNKGLALASKLLYGNNPIKKAFGYVIPQQWKYQIQIRFSKFFFKKAAMPEADRQVAEQYLDAAIRYYTNFFQ